MDIGAWFNSAVRLITQPREEVYREEAAQPYANLGAVVFWAAAAAIISAILSWISWSMFRTAGGLAALADMPGLPPDMAGNLEEMMNQSFMRPTSFGGVLGSLIGTLVGFFIGVGLLYLVARLLGGQGDFTRYAYLLASIYGPIAIVGALLGLVPVLGGCVALLLSIYQIYLAIIATQAGMNLTTGRAAIVVLLPVILALLLVFCVVGLGLAALAAMMGGN